MISKLSIYLTTNILNKDISFEQFPYLSNSFMTSFVFKKMLHYYYDLMVFIDTSIKCNNYHFTTIDDLAYVKTYFFFSILT